MMPYIRVKTTLKNHTLLGTTYLSSPYMEVPPSPCDGSNPGMNRLPSNSENKAGAYIFQRPFLEGPIFGGAYERREICVIKSVGLNCSGQEIYHFCFVLLCIRKLQSTSPPGGLYSKGRFNGGFFALRLWGLIFGGAYTWGNFTISEFYDNRGSTVFES